MFSVTGQCPYLTSTTLVYQSKQNRKIKMSDVFLCFIINSTPRTHWLIWFEDWGQSMRKLNIPKFDFDESLMRTMKNHWNVTQNAENNEIHTQGSFYWMEKFVKTKVLCQVRKILFLLWSSGPIIYKNFQNKVKWSANG